MKLEVYRKGQGKWPRGIAAASLVAVALFGASELYGLLRRVAAMNRPLVSFEIPFLETHAAVTWAVLVSVGVLAACGVGTWILFNHTRTVDFLIETGDEMHKVSWPWDPAAQGTCWGVLPAKGRELFNNSAVVIAGVFLVAAMLFLFDKVLTVLLSWFVRAE